MKIRIVVLALIIFMGLAPYSYCIYDEELSMIDGTVSSVNISKQSITVKGIMEQEFLITSETKITEDDIDKELEDMSVGDYVTVEYQDASSGLPRASRISIDYEKESLSE